MNTIILNCLPPGNMDMPSASLSILKSYLEYQGYSVKIIYWNLLILECITKSLPIQLDNKTANDISVLPMLPFLYRLNINDAHKQQLLLDNFSGYLRKNDLPNDFIITSAITNIQNKIDELIASKLEQIADTHSNFLFGISAKYYEWIYGLELIKFMKKIKPEVQTIAGGFTRKDSAREFISMSEHIDFCLYGEGEYSSWQLMNEMNSPEPNYHMVPNLFHRQGAQITQSTIQKLPKPDFRETIFPDYSDFFQAIRLVKMPEHIGIRLPLDGTRGCSWNRCRFCVATQGIQYFERSAASLTNEIAYQFNKHHISSFYATDDDFNPDGSDRLLKISNILNENSLNPKMEMETWLTPSTVNYDHLRALHSVCHLKLKAGFEATSDDLLIKMRKKNRFIENLLFLKNVAMLNSNFHITYSIIMGIPDETPGDVENAIDNLYCLRFYIPNNVELCFNKFQLAKGSSYYRQMNDEEKNEYEPDGYGIFVPERYISGERRFLFFFNTKSRTSNHHLWLTFKEKATEMESLSYHYSVDKKTGTYTEYANNSVVKQIPLSKTEIEILSLTNTSIMNRAELLQFSTQKGYSKHTAMNSIERLTREKLLYANDDNYLSVVNMGEL
ncbi:B12-binding domain-containing radical SAM protein [Prolixibacter bellariivorans]|nr:radical SAM protein [Prolixibacter bellariivorans]